MVVSPDPFLDECFIKKPTKRSTPADNILTSNVTLATSASAIDTSTFSPITINLENTDDGFDKNDETNVDNDNDDTNTLDEMNSSVLSNSLEDFIKDTANELNKPIETKDLEIHNESNTNNTNEFSNENLVLEIEELVDSYKKEDPNVLEEVDLSSSLVNSLESITLKKPNQVYYEIYKKARDKAKECKHAAIAAYLEAKNIKKTYLWKISKKIYISTNF